MPYVSARYMPKGPLDTPQMARPVQAMDEQGQVWSFREDSQVGDWLRYIESGGTIEPVDVVLETEPTEPIPEQPIDPNVPRAQPDVLQDAPLPGEE
jgi:hypothetical protein